MDIVLRATAMFAVIYLLLRLLGKRELSQITPFEMIVLIVIGDLTQQGVTHNDTSLTGATLAILTFAFWGLTLSWITYLWPQAERVLDGRPRVIIRNGELIDGNMRGDRLTINEVCSEMRLAGIAHIHDVAWAILEPHGKISFIKRSEYGDAQSDSPMSPLG